MSLRDHLAARIQQDGPITVADYMTDCLLHPTLGYYSTRDPLGAEGDFITAPEISQMFGELIGLALAQAWTDQGRPAQFLLTELGPGRGTLMADALRATARVPGFAKAARLVLVEASPVLRQIQARTLSNYAPRFVDKVADLPRAPLFLVANEFFDALPVRQFLRSDEGWREKRIGLQDGTLTFGQGGPADPPALRHRLDDTKPGDLVEYCPAAGPVTEEIATRISAFGGVAYIIDYGDWRSLGDTVQALRQHKHVNVLDGPGTADLTAHVDFEVLANAAKTAGCQHTKLTPQGVFLERLGISERAKALAAAVEGEAFEKIAAAHRRLTHPEEMGNLFKVLGLYPAKSAVPPGLDP